MSRLLTLLIILTLLSVPHIAQGGITFGLPPSNNLGLVGHWTFDGRDMLENVADISGQGNHGNLVGQTSTTTVVGKLGQAMQFDGVDDYVDFGDKDEFEFSGDFSIAFWYNIDSIPAQNIRFLAKSGGGTTYNIRLLTTGRFNPLVTDGILSSSILPEPTLDGQWHFFTVVLNSAESWTAYNDAVLMIQDTTDIPTGAAINDASLTLGSDTSTFLNGKIDDFRIYNRALSSAEIQRMYNASAESKRGVSTSAGSLSDGLVGHWTFDGKNITDGRIDDISGQGNHGSAVGIATSTFYTKGKLGQALDFDGVDDYISTGDMSVIEGSTRASWSFWVKPGSITQAKIPIIAKRNSNSTAESFSIVTGYGFFGDGDDVAFLWTPSDVAATESNLFSLNNWTFIVFVYDGSLTGANKLQVYVNGVEEALSSTAGVSNWPSTIPATVSEMHIGSWSNGSQFYNGSIDDVRVYDRALSASEIQQLYNMGAATKRGVSTSAGSLADGLVGHWTFDGNHITDGRIDDISGQGNHGSAINIATSTFYTKGKIGQGLEFDGVDDYVATTYNPDISGGTTASFWVYFPTNSASSFGILGSYSNRYHLGLNSSSQLIVGLGSTLLTHTNVAFSLNEWYHVVLSADTSTYDIYVNNEKLVTDRSYTNSNPGYPIYLGARNFSGSASNYTNQILDDVRIYERALTPSEIQQLYNMGR